MRKTNQTNFLKLGTKYTIVNSKLSLLVEAENLNSKNQYEN